MSSEAWDYFEKSADNVVHCKLCRSDVPIDARNGSPTTSLWVHLENYHLNDYERTEHFRSRVADQSDPESEADRKSTSSSNRSPSTAATVGPNSGSTTVSEVWNYFSKTDAKTVKCSACAFTVTHENVSRQSTAPLWRHLEKEHNEDFLKTEFYRIRKRNRDRTGGRPSVRRAPSSGDGESAERSATSSRSRSSSTAPPPWNSGVAVSELWNYFSRADAKTAKCSLCEFTLQRESNKTTGPLWVHLRDEHVEVFEMTDYCRGRRVEEGRSDGRSSQRRAPSSGDGESAERRATSSRSRSSSTAPPPWNSGVAVSELWNYFSRPDAKTAKCSLCEFTLQRESNKTTGPLWGHLRDEHVEVFEKTDYCRGRRVKEEIRCDDDENTASSLSLPKRPRRSVLALLQPYAYASVSPVARTSTVSEVWQYFTKLQENVTQCNVCNAQLCRNEARRNSTSPLWEHLKFKHREVYETTEFYKQRQLKVEALSEDDDDRPRPSSAVRAKSSTPIAASSRPTTSEVWRYFTKLTNDSVRCNTCKSDVSKTSSGRQSTSPLWDHLKSMHPKTFALTDFCRQRHIKVETLSDDEQLSNPVPTDRPRTSAIASKPPSVAAASRPSVSEVWKYFTKLDGDVLLCNTCKKEVCRSALRKSSTSPAWEHLRFKHRAVFETTEFFKQRQAKEEAIKKEGDSDASNLNAEQEVEPSNVRVDTDPGQQMHQTIGKMTVEVAAFLACGTASVPSTGSTGVLGKPPGQHAAANADLPAPAPLRIHEHGFDVPDLDSRAQAELYDEVIPKETGTDDSYLGVAQEVEPSSGRVSTSLDQRMHQTVTKMALEVAAFLACGTASVTSTTTNDVVGEPLEYHASDSDLPAPAPLRVHEPGFSIKELLLVAPAEISDVPLIVFDSFAGVGAFRPVAQVPNEADEQKISSRTMYSEEQRALLEDAFHRVRFPSWEEKSRLAERLGVTEEAVSIWFQNRRNKEKKVHSGGSNIKVEMGDAVSPALENGCSPLLSGRPTTVGASRKPRTDFSAEQRTVLEEVFRRTKHVEKEELLHLAQQLNVLEKSVRTWFQNRRAKDKRTSANANLSNVTIVVNDDDGGHDNRSTQEARPAMPAATELDKQVASFFDSVKENFMALSKEEKEAAKTKILQALHEQESVALHASDVPANIDDSEESDASEDTDDSDVSDASSLPLASLSEGAALPSLSDWFGH